MRKINLDSIFLLILGFLFLSQHVNQPIFYLVFFVSLGLYIWLDMRTKPENSKINWQKYLLFFIILSCLAVTMLPNIVLRYGNHQRLPGHDNPTQIEAAADFLLAGQNPYTEDYFGTVLSKQSIVITTFGQRVFNPSIYHCVKLPWHIISAIPFKLLSQSAFGFYDQRIVYLLLFVISLFIIYALPKKPSDKRLFTILYGLNPLFVPFLVIGMGDIFVLFWLILSIYLLKKQKIKLSALVLGLACVSKHSAWFFVPFFLLHVYWQNKDLHLNWWQNIKKLISQALPLALVFLAFMLPFIIWDPVSFWQDIYLYPSGALATSYHINGYGFSMLLYSLDIIQTIHSLYPAWVFQLPLGLLLFYFLYKQQKKNNTLTRAVLGYGLFIFVFWFFSRFFHDNYIGFLSTIFLLAYFVDKSPGSFTTP